MLNNLPFQNYIAACDYIITKPGWNTVVEAILGGVPLLMIERDEVIEDKTILEKVKNLGLGTSISQKEVLNLKMKEKLKKLDRLRDNFNRYDNQIKQITDKIISVLLKRTG